MFEVWTRNIIIKILGIVYVIIYALNTATTSGAVPFTPDTFEYIII